MSEVKEMWHSFICDGRGCYLVNDPEITFQDHEEAEAYCDEQNRNLLAKAALWEREQIANWLRSLDREGGEINRFLPTTLANWIEEGMHMLSQKEQTK